MGRVLLPEMVPRGLPTFRKTEKAATKKGSRGPNTQESPYINVAVKREQQKSTEAAPGGIKSPNGPLRTDQPLCSCYQAEPNLRTQCRRLPEAPGGGPRIQQPPSSGQPTLSQRGARRGPQSLSALLKGTTPHPRERRAEGKGRRWKKHDRWANRDSWRGGRAEGRYVLTPFASNGFVKKDFSPFGKLLRGGACKCPPLPIWPALHMDPRGN